MATAINHLEAQVGGKLPSQPEANPKNVSAMTLRSGNEVEEPKKTIPAIENEEEIEKKIGKEENMTPKVNSNPSIQVRSNLPPFPSRLAKSKKENWGIKTCCCLRLIIP